MWAAIPVTGTPMRVCWWKVPPSAAPGSEEEVADWLNAQWADMAHWVIMALLASGGITSSANVRRDSQMSS